MPIITPISHLSSEKYFFKKVLRFGLLEVRDNSNFIGYEDYITMYHSEFELTQPWSEKDKEKLKNFIPKFPFLKGISFHMVTKYCSYTFIDGVAHGKGKPLSENSLLNNASNNVKWLKENFPKLLFLLENNNDLGSDAYDIVTNPNFIKKLVLDNDIHFLYDHGHAMISSFNQNISLQEYFDKLPISRVQQVHLSEPTFLNNIAKDSHLAPSSSQIKFCIKNFGSLIQGYTIEFYKSLSGLEDSLNELKVMYENV